MDDEDRLRDVDRRITTALVPDVAVTRRVVAAALRDRSRTPYRRRMGILTMAASLLMVAGAAYWRWSVGAVTPRAEVTITGTGTSVIVERSDGRRMLFAGEPPSAPEHGSYVIVVHGPGASK